MAWRPNLRVLIHSPSDTDSNLIQWRDHRIKHELAEAARAAGHDLCFDEEDVNIWIHGLFTQPILPNRRHIAWVISHPTAWLAALDEQPQILNCFEKVFCASDELASEARRRGMDAEYLPCPAPRRPDTPPEIDRAYDLAIVANGAKQKNRTTLLEAFKRHKALVIGGGWDGAQQANYIPWKDIPRVVNISRLYLHTAYPDMRAWGLMPDNVLDIAANTRTLVLHDSRKAAATLPLAGPTFNSEGELLDLCAALLSDENRRAELQAAQHADALKHVGHEHAIARMLA